MEMAGTLYILTEFWDYGFLISCIARFLNIDIKVKSIFNSDENPCRKVNMKGQEICRILQKTTATQAKCVHALQWQHCTVQAIDATRTKPRMITITISHFPLAVKSTLLHSTCSIYPHLLGFLPLMFPGLFHVVNYSQHKFIYPGCNYMWMVLCLFFSESLKM